MTQPSSPGPKDRDKFYSEPDPMPISTDDGDDYELEPPDEDVTAHVRARSEETLQEAEHSVDVDKFYRELNAVGDWDDLGMKLRTQFSIFHLLVAMTFVAICFGIWRAGWLNGGIFAVFVVLSLVGLTAAHLYLNWKEKKRQAELIAKHQYQMQKARAEEGIGDEPDEASILSHIETPLDEIKEAIFPPLRFSAGEFFGALPIAGIITALLAFAGNLYTSIASLGVLAITIMGVYAIGNVVPRFIRLAWWLAVIGTVIAHGILGAITLV